jgi:hypothetical protein
MPASMTVSCFRKRKVPVIIPKLDLHHLPTELKEEEEDLILPCGIQTVRPLWLNWPAEIDHEYSPFDQPTCSHVEQRLVS